MTIFNDFIKTEKLYDFPYPSPNADRLKHKDNKHVGQFLFSTILKQSVILSDVGVIGHNSTITRLGPQGKTPAKLSSRLQVHHN